MLKTKIILLILLKTRLLNMMSAQAYMLMIISRQM